LIDCLTGIQLRSQAWTQAAEPPLTYVLIATLTASTTDVSVEQTSLHSPTNSAVCHINFDN